MRENFTEGMQNTPEIKQANYSHLTLKFKLNIRHGH